MNYILSSLNSEEKHIAVIQFDKKVTKLKLESQIKTCLKEHYDAKKVKIKKIPSKDWQCMYLAEIVDSEGIIFNEQFELIPVALYRIKNN